MEWVWRAPVCLARDLAHLLALEICVVGVSVSSNCVVEIRITIENSNPVRLDCTASA
jgi:hypothetical protein